MHVCCVALNFTHTHTNSFVCFVANYSVREKTEIMRENEIESVSD